MFFSWTPVCPSRYPSAMLFEDISFKTNYTNIIEASVRLPKQRKKNTAPGARLRQEIGLTRVYRLLFGLLFVFSFCVFSTI